MVDIEVYTIDAVIQRLKDARDAGELNFNTARTRITALSKLRYLLTEEEISDVSKINKKVLAEKLRAEGGVNEGTIQTYLTRLEKSIDFKVGRRNYNEKVNESSSSDVSKTTSPKVISKETLAIAIGGAIVRITNLPSLLTVEQADEICMVVKEFAEKR